MYLYSLYGMIASLSIYIFSRKDVDCILMYLLIKRKKKTSFLLWPVL